MDKTTWRPRRHEMKVPARWLEMLLTERDFNEGQLLFYLKAIYGYKVEKRNLPTKKIASALNRSRRTIERTLKQLVARNWVGLDQKTSIYYPRGWDVLCSKEKINSRQAYWFDLKDIQIFKSFVIAACVSNLIESQKWEAKKRRNATKAGKQQSVVHGFPIAVRAFSAIYKISIATASRDLNQAVGDGFLIRKRCYIAQKELHGKITDNVALRECRKALNKHYFKTKSGKIIEVKPSEFKSTLFRRRRNKRRSARMR